MLEQQSQTPQAVWTVSMKRLAHLVLARSDEMKGYQDLTPNLLAPVVHVVMMDEKKLHVV